MDYVEKLMDFGLTRQEALIYHCLLIEGKTTGYEVAKQVGISRSNAYNSLASLTDKGGAYIAYEGTVKKYIPVGPEEFLGNRIDILSENKNWLLENLPNGKNDDDGYITIEGSTNILSKIKYLIRNSNERIYLSCARDNLLLFVEEIEMLIRKKRKLVIITDKPVTLPNVKVYIGEKKGHQIGIISDSKYALTGEFGEGSLNTCLYSGQKNFIKWFKKAMANELEVLMLYEEKREREAEEAKGKPIEFRKI